MNAKRQWVFASTVIATLFVLFTVTALAHERNAHPTPTPSPAATSSNEIQTPQAAIVESDMPVNEFPNYHPLVVHFPIVLLMTAAAFQVLSFFFFKREFGWAVFLLLIAAAIFVWLASNVFHAHATGLSGRAAEIFLEHEQFADYTWWIALGALAAKFVSQLFTKQKWWSEAVVMILLAAGSVTVAIAGHHGAQLVHLEGVGPKGKNVEMHEH